MRFDSLLDDSSMSQSGILSDCDELIMSNMAANSSTAQAFAHISHPIGTGEYKVSAWTQSIGKRIFDCICVLVSLPLILPIVTVIAFLVRITSRGPVLFIQDRVGLHGETFRIVKFRTMEHLQKRPRNAITSSNNQKFTPIGPFLRRFKLDELPQLFNVLKGDMSLVGPRPKMPEHVKHDLSCRPGITGYATLAFAREEMFFSALPKDDLEVFYHNVVLLTKLHLDRQYMTNATFSSDFFLIINTVLRRWNTLQLNQLVDQYMHQTGLKEAVPRTAEKLQLYPMRPEVSANPFAWKQALYLTKVEAKELDRDSFVSKIRTSVPYVECIPCTPFLREKLREGVLLATSTLVLL